MTDRRIQVGLIPLMLITSTVANRHNRSGTATRLNSP